MVGVIAAQTLGEPVTQIALNKIYFAGASSEKGTVGLARLKEIINLTKKPKNPTTTVFLKGIAALDGEMAKTVLYRLEHTTLRKVTANTSIHYDPDFQNSVIAEDQELSFYNKLPDFDPAGMSPWFLRFELGRKMMMEDDMFLRKIEANLFSDMTLQGIKSISKVTMHRSQTDDQKRIVVTDTGELEAVAQ